MQTQIHEDRNARRPDLGLIQRQVRLPAIDSSRELDLVCCPANSTEELLMPSSREDRLHAPTLMGPHLRQHKISLHWSYLSSHGFVHCFNLSLFAHLRIPRWQRSNHRGWQ